MLIILHSRRPQIFFHLLLLQMDLHILNNIFTFIKMDFPFSHLYLICTLFTTLAFVYLIFRFFLINSKKILIEQHSTQDNQCLNDNIVGLITDLCFTESQEHPSKSKESTVLTPTAKKIIKNRKERTLFKGDHHRQCCFLPGSDSGLLEMKHMNKKYIRDHQNDGFLGLVKQKKKKNLSNCVKKYGFHKTTLVTIYEQFQY